MQQKSHSVTVELEQSKLVDTTEFGAIRTHFEETLVTIALKKGITQDKKAEPIYKKLMQKIIDDDITYDELNSYLGMLEIFGISEKKIINEVFGGNLLLYKSHISYLKSLDEDHQKILDDDLQIHVSEQTGKDMLNGAESTQIRTHSLHFQKGLGDNAGNVSLYNRGYVYQLFADGYLQEITPKQTQQLIRDRYDILISERTASEIAKELNTSRRIFEGKLIQGSYGDSKTTKDAISIITSDGKRKGLSFEKTNLMGEEARKACEKFDHIAGKIIGQSKVNGDCPELNKKTASLVLDLIKTTDQDFENVLAIITKLKSKLFSR